MNFATFYQEILGSVFADKDSPRLTKRHRNAVSDALTRIQRYAKCYRGQHQTLIRQDDSMFVGGVSVFDRPPGQPWEVRIERLDATQDFVLANPYTFAQMRALAETSGSCIQDTQCGPYGYGYGDYYFPGVCAPAPAVCLPTNYAVALDDASMYLYPSIHVCTQVKVSWTGIKRTWGDDDLVPWLDEDGYVDRDIMQAVEYFLHYDSMVKDNCDPEKGAIYLSMFMQKLAELNAICSRRNEVVGPPILFPWASSARSSCVLSEPAVDDEGNTVTPQPRPEVAIPVFSPPGGNYLSGPTVVITSATEGASIYFTTNNTEPNENSELYNTPLPVTKGVTLRARAFKEGYRPSGIATASYSVTLPNVANPVVTPPTGTYTGSVLCSITCATPGATILFTRDFNPPTYTSEVFSQPFLITADSHIQAIAVKTGMSPSGYGYADYTIQSGTVAAPVMSPSPGNYCAAQSIVLSCATPLAKIRYTINGDEPTQLSAEYTQPLVLSMYGSLNIRAKAFRNGFIASAESTGKYNAILCAPLITFDPPDTQRYQWSWEVPGGDNGNRTKVNVDVNFQFPLTGQFATAEIWFTRGDDTDTNPTRNVPYDSQNPSAQWLSSYNASYSEIIITQFKAITWLAGHYSTVSFGVARIVFPVFFGSSTLAQLNPNQVRALSSNLNHHYSSADGIFVWTAPIGDYDVVIPAGSNRYIYLAWDSSYPAPLDTTGFKIGTTPVPMVAVSPYDQSENTWGFMNLDMEAMLPNGSPGPGGAPFKVFRSLNTYAPGTHRVTITAAP